MGIVDRIHQGVPRGTVIPKPSGSTGFVVKGWGKRRGETALVYTIPNHGSPSKPHEKGIAQSEFEAAYSQLRSTGELTHSWFKARLPACAKEGACNYTSIGGVLQLLGEAQYAGRGVYSLRLKR